MPNRLLVKRGPADLNHIHITHTTRRYGHEIPNPGEGDQRF